MPKILVPKQSQPTSFRLSPEAIAIMAELKMTLGFKSRDDIVELALRTLAGWVKPPEAK